MPNPPIKTEECKQTCILPSALLSNLEDIIDKNFPKGKCKERGRALMVYAEFCLMIKGLEVNEYEPPCDGCGKQKTP